MRYFSPMEARVDRILVVSLGTWKEEIRPGTTGEIRIPPEAFGGREQETLKLKISGLFDPGNGDPRRLGLFIW